jgi:hypothetical protein
LIGRQLPQPLDADRRRRALQQLVSQKLGGAIGVNMIVGLPITGTAPAAASLGHDLERDAIRVGKLFQVRGHGKYSTVGDTCKIELMAGTVVLIDSGNVTLAAATDKPWTIKAQIHGLATGTTGSVQAFLELLDFNGTATRKASTVSSIDTTQQHAVHLRVTWGTADAGNTFTEQIFAVTDVGA